MKLRPLLVAWHRWFGLLAGLWLFVLGLTGSILVFYDEIDHALNRDLLSVDGSSTRLEAATLVAGAEATRPGSYASYVDLPDHEGESLMVYLSPRATGTAAIGGELVADVPLGLQVFVDPYTAKVLGERVYGAWSFDRRHLPSFIYQLHLNLNLGGGMAWFLGLVAVLWLLDHVPAVVLSFPSRRLWAKSLRVRRGARGFAFVYGLHRAAGLWLFAITSTLALTGVYFNWYEEFRAAVNAVSPLTASYGERAPALVEPAYTPAVTIDQAIHEAQRNADGARVDTVSVLPQQGLYALRLFDERDLAGYGERSVYVDSSSGAIRADRHPSDGTAGDRFLALQFPLHSGQLFGWPGRLAVLVGGIAVCFFSASGIAIWARKRSRAARAALHARFLNAPAEEAAPCAGAPSPRARW